MTNQWKRLAIMAGFSAVLVLLTSNAFALGRSKKSGYRGWSQAATSPDNTNGGINENGTEIPSDVPGRDSPSSDSNPVPEPASMVLLGSALAGLGGYRGLRKRLARR